MITIHSSVRQPCRDVTVNYPPLQLHGERYNRDYLTPNVEEFNLFCDFFWKLYKKHHQGHGKLTMWLMGHLPMNTVHLGCFQKREDFDFWISQCLAKQPFYWGQERIIIKIMLQ